MAFRREILSETDRKQAEREAYNYNLLQTLSALGQVLQKLHFLLLAQLAPLPLSSALGL